MLRCSEALIFVQVDASNVFDAAHSVDKALVSSSNADTVFLLRAAQRYVTNPDRPKEEFPVYAFCKAGAQYLRVP